MIEPTKEDLQMSNKAFGNFGVCHCPGKQLAKGRDGKSHSRNIEEDIKYFKTANKVDVIICLLDEYELRTVGVDLKR